MGESESGKTTFSKHGVKPIAAKYVDPSCTAVPYLSPDQEAMAKMEKMPDTSNDSDIVLRDAV